MDEKTFERKLASKGQPKSRLILIGYREHIRRALELGYTMREVHTLLADEGIYPFDYSSFTRGIKKFVIDAVNEKGATNTAPLPSAALPDQAQQAPGGVRSPTGPTISEIAPTGFIYKAKANPKDLI